MKEEILIRDIAGEFAENKEVAKKLRLEVILPALESEREIVVDFAGVSGATQSFIHAMVSDPIRKFGDRAYENMYYVNANGDIQEIISIVYRYMQESLN